MKRPAIKRAVLMRFWIAAISCTLLSGGAGGAQDVGDPDQVIWTFDRLDRIGGHPTTVLGNPRIIDTPLGRAVEFDGIDDALFVDVHPLAGAKTFTWEATFRPDGGDYEQRWFHLQETGSDNRMLFEIRVTGDRWFLDSFNFSTTGTATLMNKDRLHPVGAWYHVAAVYDGKVFSSYVNGVQQAAAEVQLSPQGPGRSSIGVRINLVNYFKGAIHSARFTRRALGPAEFLDPRHAVFNVNTGGETPELARDAFWKLGSGGHALYVVPSLDLVVWKLVQYRYGTAFAAADEHAVARPDPGDLPLRYTRARMPRQDASLRQDASSLHD